MTKDERQQSLINARSAYYFLRKYIESQIETPSLRQEITCLLDEFKRLDEKEQKQIKEGKRGGKLGGRPRKNGGKK
jgi:hypothetical protein